MLSKISYKPLHFHLSTMQWQSNRNKHIYHKIKNCITVYQNTIIQKNQNFFNEKNVVLKTRHILSMQQHFFRTHPEFASKYFETMMSSMIIHRNHFHHAENSYIYEEKRDNQRQEQITELEKKLQRMQRDMNNFRKENVQNVPLKEQSDEKYILQKSQNMMMKRLRYENYRRGKRE